MSTPSTNLNVKVNILAQADEFRKTAREIKQNASELQGINDDAAKELNRQANLYKQLAAAIDDVGAAQELLGEAQQALSDAPIEQKAEKFREFKTAIDLNRDAVQRLAAAEQATFGSAAKQTDARIAKIRQLEAELKRLLTLQEKLSKAEATPANKAELSGVAAQISAVKNRLAVLNDIGEKGDKSLANILPKINQLGSLFDDLLPQLGPVGKGLEGISGSLTGLGEAAASLGPLGAVTAGLATIIGTAVSVTAVLFNLSQSFANVARETQQLQQATKLSKEFLAGLKLGIESLPDPGSVNDLIDGVAQFEGVLRDAAAGSQDAQANLAKLDVTNFSNVEAALRQITASLQNGGAAARATAADFGKAFGEEGGRQFQPLLGNIDEFIARAKSAGLVLGDDLVAKAGLLNSAIGKLKSEVDGISLLVGGRFAEAFTLAAESALRVFESLKQNKEFRDDLENIAQVLERFISGQLPGLISLVGSVLEVVVSTLGELAREINIVLTLIGALQGTLGGAANSTNKAAEATKRFGDAASNAKPALEGLLKAVKDVADAQKLQLDTAETAAKSQRQLYEDLANSNVITNQRAAEVIAITDEELAQKRIDAAYRTFAAAKTALDQRKKDESATSAEIDKLQDEVTRRSIELNNARMAKDKQVADNKKNINAAILKDEQEANASIATDAAQLNAQLAEQFRQRLKTEEVVQLARVMIARDTAAKNLATEESALAKIIAKTNANSEEAIAQRKKVAEARQALAERERDIEVETARQAQAIRESLFAIEESKRGAVLNQLRALEKEKILSNTQLQQRVAQQELTSLQQQLTLKNAQIADAEKLAKGEAEINGLIAQRITLETQVKSKRAELLDLAKKEQQETRARNEQRINETLAAVDAENRAMEQRVQTFLAGNAAVANALTDLASRVDFGEVTEGNLEAAKQKAREIAEISKNVEDVFLRLPDAISQAQKFIVDDAATRIAGKIGAIERTIAAKNALAIAQEKIRTAEAAEKDITAIVENEAERRAEINRKADKDLRKLGKKLTEAEGEETQKRIDLVEQQKDKIIAIETEEKARLAQLEKEKTENAIAEAREREAFLEGITRAAEQKAIDRNIANAEKLGDLEIRLAEAKATALAAKTEGKSQEAIDEANAAVAAIEAEIAKAEQVQKRQQDRERKRQEEIAAAKAKAVGELANAGSPEERKAIEEKLAAEVGAINERFDREQEIEEKILELKEKGATRAAEILAEELAKENKLRDDALKSELQRIADKALQEKRLREEKEAADKAAFDKRVADAKAANERELADFDKASATRIQTIKDELAQIEKQREKDLIKLEADTKKALDKVKEQYGDFFKAINTGSINGVKDLDGLLQKLREITAEAKAAAQAASEIIKTNDAKNGKTSSNVGGFNITAPGSDSNSSNNGNGSPTNINKFTGDNTSNNVTAPATPTSNQDPNGDKGKTNGKPIIKVFPSAPAKPKADDQAELERKKKQELQDKKGKQEPSAEQEKRKRGLNDKVDGNNGDEKGRPPRRVESPINEPAPKAKNKLGKPKKRLKPAGDVKPKPAPIPPIKDKAPKKKPKIKPVKGGLKPKPSSGVQPVSQPQPPAKPSPKPEPLPSPNGGQIPAPTQPNNGAPVIVFNPSFGQVIVQLPDEEITPAKFAQLLVKSLPNGLLQGESRDAIEQIVRIINQSTAEKNKIGKLGGRVPRF